MVAYSDLINPLAIAVSHDPERNTFSTALHGTQNQKCLAESRQCENRADTHYPPVQTNQAFQALPLDWIAAFNRLLEFWFAQTKKTSSATATNVGITATQNDHGNSTGFQA